MFLCYSDFGARVFVLVDIKHHLSDKDMFCSNGFCHVSVFSATSYLVSLFVVIDWLTLILYVHTKGNAKA
jgi:hypothetical protein